MKVIFVSLWIFFCVALDRQVVANTVNINILKCRLSIVSPRYGHKCLDGPYTMHRSGIYYRRPAGEKYSDGSPSNTALNGNIPISPTGNPPNTVTQISRSRVRGCPQQPPYSLLGECGNNAPLITSQGFNAKTPNPKIHDILQIQYGSVQRP